ncbi:MAG: glycerol-3-phosphate acyltransferase [Meiothermus sp.]|uniref:glycerol-3-phosphate acyltransferase n=1 Tax=Meiothermus sp. TaxID=1955249 RepID=UPI0025EC563C|nr:glycerol-3-phosphate acyltransferase [Meiothermus sp.]MCS7194351.1 glycerol-3-phosphate acyltransferase [Meiothermus sp.]MDW8089832.1 glycerol-3-phosphate acyltransferase [Meiothermus sp.]
MDGLWVLGAYLLGALSFGQVVGRLRGVDLAERDTPGASGAFRQLGAGWGLAVALGDILKGALAAYMSTFTQASWGLPLVGAAVVAGHNWPVFFGFRGGGGIAPTLGFFVFLYPALVLPAVGLGLGVAGLYWLLYWRNHPQSWYPIPVGAMAGYLYALWALWPTGAGFWALLLVTLLVAVRGLRIARKL